MLGYLLNRISTIRMLEHLLSQSHHISSGKCTHLQTVSTLKQSQRTSHCWGTLFISSIPHARVLSCSESTHFFMPTTHLRMVRTHPHAKSSSWTELAHFLVPTDKLWTSQVFSQPITRPIPNHNFWHWDLLNVNCIGFCYYLKNVYCTGCLKTDFSNNKPNTSNQLKSFIGGTIFYLL